MTLIDGVNVRESVVYIETTNRTYNINTEIMRFSWFDREIDFRVPNKVGRMKIKIIKQKIRNFQMMQI